MGKVQRQTSQYRDHLFVSVPYSSQFAISNPQIVNIRIISEKGQWERNRKVKSIWYSISKESIHLSYFLSYTWYLLIVSFILETSSKQTGQQCLWISWLNPQHLDWEVGKLPLFINTQNKGPKDLPIGTCSGWLRETNADVSLIQDIWMLPVTVN